MHTVVKPDGTIREVCEPVNIRDPDTDNCNSELANTKVGVDQNG